MDLGSEPTFLRANPIKRDVLQSRFSRSINKGHSRPHHRQGKCAYTGLVGRRQNTSVETGDFLQKNVKCMLVDFGRSVTPSPHVRVKGHLGDGNQPLLYYTW